MPALTTSHTRPASLPVVAAQPTSQTEPPTSPPPASSSRLSRHASPARPATPARQLRHGHTYPHLTHRVIHNVSRRLIHIPRF